MEPFALHEAPYLSLIFNAENAWEHGLPRTLLPFCPDNGNYFCMSALGDSPEVVYWDHNGPAPDRWDDLATWIEMVWIGEYDNTEMENIE
ncbi:MAG: SMI1/KNR4 family protein [Capsulimonas sp.]|uniref:SMI1/KNR4 family protein n=1 Tax=Capsulimonas sp. TaxID=2494211 RepID=UPI0032636372